MEIEEAREVFLSGIDPIMDRSSLSPVQEMVPLEKAAGRILAENVTASFPVPHFSKSAMDGYAVRAEDIREASREKPAVLRVLYERLAGDLPEEEKNLPAEGRNLPAQAEGLAQTAVRIMTGAALPEGYDAVVRQEDTDYGEKEVRVFASVPAYRNICRKGEDIEEGSSVLLSGSRIGRVEAGVLASLGTGEVPVLRPVRVHILSTGSELLEPGEAWDNDRVDAGERHGRRREQREASVLQSGTEKKCPPAGKIFSSIPYALMAGLSGGCFSVRMEICPDEPEALIQALSGALECADIVITTGGVSVGKKDLLPDILDRVGAKKLFSGVNVQPGTPTIGSVKDGIPILSLSGNPYAALVNFDLYFWHAAAKLTGCPAFLPRTLHGVMGEDYPKKNRLRRLLRAEEREGCIYLPAENHASSVIGNLLGCNCYIDLPAETSLKKGDVVRIIRMAE